MIDARSRMIGHELLGTGAHHVVILNDWTCDTSTWDGARPYLDLGRFTYALTDLRGYGRSIDRAGTFNLLEAVADVLVLADGLGWPRFAIVGHSMSTLVALDLAQHRPDRIERAVVLTPPPPRGFGATEEVLAHLRRIARADDAARIAALRDRWSAGMSEPWVQLKAARWRATAHPEAVATYAAMFARDGLPEPTAPIELPVLAVTGERDAEIMRRASVTGLLAPLCARLEVVALADCGHYPMQEAPPRLVAIVERFLGGGQPSS
jgi:pimeloyl-ACP methyl ester carboxylesterase